MTDRIDKLQRLHEADLASRKLEFCDPSGSIKRDALLDAMRNALPALLRVARAARKVADDLRGDEAVDDLHEALAELDKP